MKAINKYAYSSFSCVSVIYYAEGAGNASQIPPSTHGRSLALEECSTPQEKADTQ